MKKLIIVMAVATGFVGCQNDVGRYQLVKDDLRGMIDTKTGDVYVLNAHNELNQLHLKNNEPVEWELSVEK